MPRYTNKGNNNWKRQGHNKPAGYYDHGNRQGGGDHGNRQGGGDQNRRVSFPKSNRLNKHSRKDYRKLKERLLNDEDFQMSGEGTSQRRGGFNRHGKGGRSFQGPGKGRLENHTGWFRALIINGASHDKSFLLASLKNFVAPTELIPIYYQIEEHDSFFYIDDYAAAEAVMRADKQMTLTGDTKVFIRVSPCTPKVALTDRLKEKIKMVMVSRYNTETKALDLTRFHADPELVEDSCCAISRPPVMSVILEVIGEHIPTLQALNLDHNCMSVTETLSSLARRAPHLQILYLGKNRFTGLNSLNIIKGLPLIELNLEGNILCRKFDSKTDYKSAVQKMFPKLVRLDGVDLTPAIGFDLEEKKVDLPESHSSFLCSEEGRDITLEFVKQYFGLYDSIDRSGLINAYHDTAVFSLTTAYNTPPTQQNATRLNDYLSHNRNLKRVNGHDRREELIKKGKTEISEFLCTLPRTQHDPASFTLDLSIFNAKLMLIFSLTGVFKEPDVKGEPHRHFYRKFVLLLSDAGVAIVNDMMHVTNATQNQIKKCFVAVPLPVAAVAPKPPVAAINQLEVVQSFSAQTGMNTEWSQKCLEETAWDVPRSLEVFTRLNQEGRIPQEAFIKI
ncbi:nuclear RNA export factor 1 isoform X2 [Cloeon dipterum]|uniref:nuclear RNA export factor 1 isoform X2 n=1 Tax=Cloeon dipterum TaxID=197152 RepID=UPI003220455E